MIAPAPSAEFHGIGDGISRHRTPLSRPPARAVWNVNNSSGGGFTSAGARGEATSGAATTRPGGTPPPTPKRSDIPGSPVTSRMNTGSTTTATNSSTPTAPNSRRQTITHWISRRQGPPDASLPTGNSYCIDATGKSLTASRGNLISAWRSPCRRLHVVVATEVGVRRHTSYIAYVRYLYWRS